MKHETVHVSQLKGCVLCVDLHFKDATLNGERARYLHHVAVWKLFSPHDRRG
jgi:AhpD family alkylhydroperoxidase